MVQFAQVVALLHQLLHLQIPSHIEKVGRELKTTDLSAQCFYLVTLRREDCSFHLCYR